MVLIRSAEKPSTLSRWSREVCAAESKHDGMVHRGGRWLQRRDRGREQSWLQDTPHERSSALRGKEGRRIAAALHHLESAIEDPSDRAIFQRSLQDERLQRLLYTRLIDSYEPEVVAAMHMLEDRRQMALLRPGLDALRTTLSDEESTAAFGSSQPSSHPSTPAAVGGVNSVSRSGGGSGSSLSPVELQQAEMRWDETCQALAEEWQLLIEVRLRRERAAAVASEYGATNEAMAGPADGSPHKSEVGAWRCSACWRDADSSALAPHRRKYPRFLRMDSSQMDEWTRQLVALSAWRAASWTRGVSLPMANGRCWRRESCEPGARRRRRRRRRRGGRRRASGIGGGVRLLTLAVWVDREMRQIMRSGARGPGTPPAASGGRRRRGRLQVVVGEEEEEEERRRTRRRRCFPRHRV